MYRSTDPTDGAPPAGCLETMTVTFEGPDTQCQRNWINNVFASSGTSQAALEAGLIAAHFHVSLDGTRVLNPAEWTTAEALAPRLRRTTQHFPGVADLAVHRFTPYRGIAAVDG